VNYKLITAQKHIHDTQAHVRVVMTKIVKWQKSFFGMLLFTTTLCVLCREIVTVCLKMAEL